MAQNQLQLPVEILLQVFSYLKFSGQVAAVQTCHLWRNIILDTKSLGSQRYHTEADKDKEKLRARWSETEDDFPPKSTHNLHRFLYAEYRFTLTIRDGETEKIVFHSSYRSQPIDIR